VTGEASFSSGKGSLLVEFLDFGIEMVEGVAQWSGQVVRVGQPGVPLGPQDAEIQLAVKERDFQAVAGRGVAVGLRNAMNEAFEPKGGCPSGC
jgi:hypothetical protein